eukprot:613065-Rhodomonas_salina.1
MMLCVCYALSGTDGTHCSIRYPVLMARMVLPKGLHFKRPGAANGPTLGQTAGLEPGMSCYAPRPSPAVDGLYFDTDDDYTGYSPIRVSANDMNNYGECRRDTKCGRYDALTNVQ